MLLNVMDYKKTKKYEKENRPSGIELQYSSNYTPNGILQCYKNKEFVSMEFKHVPIKGEIILLSSEKDNLFEWKVVGFYYLNNDFFVVVRTVNCEPSTLQPYIHDMDIDLKTKNNTLDEKQHFFVEVNVVDNKKN